MFLGRRSKKIRKSETIFENQKDYKQEKALEKISISLKI